MATIALATLGATVGSSVLPGVSFFGVSVGAALGRTAGALVGSYIDSQLFASGGTDRQFTSEEGPRLGDLNITASTYGADLPRVYGRVRIGGQIIWATNIEEVRTSTTVSTSTGGGSSGGKGFGGGGQQAQPSTTTTRVSYDYYANFAVALCHGEITTIGRIWADGKLLDQSKYNFRVYKGTSTQNPDSLISAKTPNTPAYRGVAYVVFERMHLNPFGNRIPNLTFEVHRSVDEFENLVTAVTIIPGSGEFTYDTTEVYSEPQPGTTVSENVHTFEGVTDWTSSINKLQDTLPNIKTTGLVVSWFGTDLRVDQCQVLPKVDNNVKVTEPYDWLVSDLTRQTAQTTSLHDGRPAYGGTPSDISVIHAIQDLNARSVPVVFYPFILMDIPVDNSLTDPYTNSSSQPAYPWRGRITCNPAPSTPGTPDKTPECQIQLDAFIGQAQPSDFTVSGTTITYSGPAEWSYRRFILHYAHLCNAAGGVDGFLVGTELRGLTQLRSSQSYYPFVQALRQLAADVKSILGAQTKVTYAADWSEYFGHHPSDGTNDVYFHLDPLWSDANIDAIGIDAYWPLSDWRDGNVHKDYLSGVTNIYDLDYLRSNISGGEGYDWYYASSADRDSQTRTDITDGFYNKPWVFRYKDIKSWWQNQHFDRPGGVESTSPTAWVPESKPFWLTEIGCPAIDKGSNQPNVFVDPKSSESFFPYYSTGTRDDYIQRRYLTALYQYFDPSHSDYISGSNPQSSKYSGRMVDTSKMFTYTWDARPYPQFPFNFDVWGDGPNWEFGHWLTGRLANGPLSSVLSQVCLDHKFTKFTLDGIRGIISGYVIDKIMTGRQAIQPLEAAFQFDSYSSSGVVKFTSRGLKPTLKSVTSPNFVDRRKIYEITSGDKTTLPLSSKVTFIDSGNDYRQNTVSSTIQYSLSTSDATANLPIVMDTSTARNVADNLLWDAHNTNEKLKFELPLSHIDIEPTDILSITLHPSYSQTQYTAEFRVISVRIQNKLAIEALSTNSDVFIPAPSPSSLSDTSLPSPPTYGPPLVYFMDLPLLTPDASEESGYIAGYQDPWPGTIDLYISPDNGSYQSNSSINNEAIIGVTTTDLPIGPHGRFDYGTQLGVKLYSGELSSASDPDLFMNANTCAVQLASGEWEILQFADATLTSESNYTLTKLLRGQKGTDSIMEQTVPAGARFVLLDATITQPSITSNEWNVAYNWKYGPSGLPITHYSYQTSQAEFKGIGTRPYAPSHISSILNSLTGDLTISWIRRTRYNGDGWEVQEVPLNETLEQYLVEILDPSQAVIRSFTTTTPSFVYTQDQRITDYGTDNKTPTINVAQISEKFGIGLKRTTTIPLTKIY